MTPKVAKIPITNVIDDGDYTGTIYFGSNKTPANVILDTGSSTLAIDGKHYKPTDDKGATITDYAQAVLYGSGSWIGSVTKSDVVIGEGEQAIPLQGVNMAVTYHESKDMFGKSDGILGLAYKPLNDAYKMPKATWPPHYTYNQIMEGKLEYIEPYFTQLEESGIVANKFAFYTLRSMVSHAQKDPSKDPINNGYLILGGGEQFKDLYEGSFQSVRVLHDFYYNTNLKAVEVGNSPPIPIAPSTKGSGLASNSVVDSGTNGLALAYEVFQAIQNSFKKSYPELKPAFGSYAVSMNDLDLAKWPDITFVLEGMTHDVRLTVKPDTYWQSDAPNRGFATCVMYSLPKKQPPQSILGLPLLNNYFTIFDRSANKGLGTIEFAPIKQPSA